MKMELMKKCKIIVLTLFTTTVLLICTACSYDFALQDIMIAHPFQTKSHREFFNLGNFEVDLTEIPEENCIVFNVKDTSSFLRAIQDHPSFIKQELNNKQYNVYLFLDSGTHFLLITNKGSGKKDDYILRPAISTYVTKDGTDYQFPLYDCSVRYDGMLFFHEDQGGIKTINDWQYFQSFFEGLPSDFVTVNEKERSAVLSVSTFVDGEWKIDLGKKIKILYEEGENGNSLSACLISENDLP